MTRIGLVSFLLFVAACTPDAGERCNPLLFTDACDNARGLVCRYPKNCGVAYCCPDPEKVTPSTSSNCQECPGPDGGVLGGNDAGTNDGGVDAGSRG